MKLSDYNESVRHEMEKYLGRPLPKGIYAGGALSSIVLSKIWDKEMPVDGSFELYRDFPDPVDDDSEFVFRFTGPFKAESNLKDGYTVLSSHAEGNVIIKVCHKIGMVLGAEERAIHICRGLGINALQIAYYAYETGKGSLYATNDFIVFSRSRQLRITCPVFGRSLLELARYQELYDAYIDWNEELLLMAGFREATAIHSSECDDILKIEDKQLFDKSKEILADYCAIDEITEPVLPSLEELMQSRWKIDFHHAKSSEILPVIQQALICCGYSLTSYTYSQLYDILVRKGTKNSIKKRFWIAMANPDASFFVMNDSNYLRKDFTNHHLLEITKFNSCHPSAMNIISSLHNDFVSQVKAIRMLKKLGRIHGNSDFVIGLLERSKNYGFQVKEITEDSINKLVAAYSSIGNSAMIDPVDLSQFKYKDSVVELTSSDALMLEGIRCSNCIGGYHGAVIEGAGNLRVFHINTPGSHQHSTAAIYNHGTDDLDFDYEVSGAGNTDATEEHELITIELAYFLRDTIWKTELRDEDQTIQSCSPN